MVAGIGRPYHLAWSIQRLLVNDIFSLEPISLFDNAYYSSYQKVYLTSKETVLCTLADSIYYSGTTAA